MEATTYEDAVENNASVHVAPAPYSEPALLIRTFQGQLDAVMVEHERMRQQLSLLSNTLQAWQVEHQQIITLLRGDCDFAAMTQKRR